MQYILTVSEYLLTLSLLFCPEAVWRAVLNKSIVHWDLQLVFTFSEITCKQLQSRKLVFPPCSHMCVSRLNIMLNTHYE